MARGPEGLPPGPGVPPSWGQQARGLSQQVQQGLSRAGDGVGEALFRLSDPRARLLRRRRAAAGATAGLTGTAGLSGAGTVTLVAVGASEWLWVPGVGVTAALAVPAAAMALKLRRLRAAPLPPERFRPGPLPAVGSPAREPLARLEQARSSLEELLGVLGRDPTVPPAEIEEARAAAGVAAGRIRAEAGDLEALRRARDSSPVAARELAGVLDAAVGRLTVGVASFEDLVASAARAVAARQAPARDEDLLDAVDRIDALTEALHELAAIHGPR